MLTVEYVREHHAETYASLSNSEVQKILDSMYTLSRIAIDIVEKEKESISVNQDIIETS